MGNDWIKTTKDKIQFRLDRARGMIESIDMLKDYFKKGDWEMVVGVKQRALNCLTWKLEDAKMFHDEMNHIYEMGYKTGKGEQNATTQQCVELGDKLLKEKLWESGSIGEHAVREFQAAIKKQFGIKE